MARTEHGEGQGRRGLGAGLLVAAGLLWASGLGCGGDSSQGGGQATASKGGTGGAGGTAGPALTVSGGAATVAGGQGQNGGVVHLVAQGDVAFGPNPAAAQIPNPPSSAMAV